MKMNAWKSMSLALAIACSLTVMSCSDDDPITPVTPDPDPVLPAMTYKGYELTLQYDTVVGEDEAIKAFQALVKDSITGSGLAFKEVEVAGTGFAYNLKMTYNTADETENAKGQAIEEQCKQLARNILRISEELDAPVVTGFLSIIKRNSTGTDIDWQASGNTIVTSKQEALLSIPRLSKTTWKAVNAPEENDIKTLYFGGWEEVKGMHGTLEVGQFDINGEKQEGLSVLRRGNMIFVLNAEGKTAYGLYIPADGKQLILIQRDGATLEPDYQIVFEKEVAEE